MSICDDKYNALVEAVGGPERARELVKIHTQVERWKKFQKVTSSRPLSISIKELLKCAERCGVKEHLQSLPVETMFYFLKDLPSYIEKMEKQIQTPVSNISRVGPISIQDVRDMGRLEDVMKQLYGRFEYNYSWLATEISQLVNWMQCSDERASNFECVTPATVSKWCNASTKMAYGPIPEYLEAIVTLYNKMFN